MNSAGKIPVRSNTLPEIKTDPQFLLNLRPTILVETSGLAGLFGGQSKVTRPMMLAGAVKGIITNRAKAEKVDLSKLQVGPQDPPHPSGIGTGYISRPLEGIWASAPYFHNGSVPNLYETLLPSAKRAKTFWVGTRELDPVKVGFVTAKFSTGSEFQVAHILPQRFECNASQGNGLLQGCDIISHLNGMYFDQLPTTVQNRIRRAHLRTEVIRQGTDSRFAYHMFKRLNTGGELLSAQEVRNCSIRLLGSKFNDFIFDLTDNEDFQKCIEDISEEYKKRMGAQELVLRFFAFKNNLGEFTHNINEFLTSFMERVTDQNAENHIKFDYAQERNCFEMTFKILGQTLASKAFKRWQTNSYAGGFSMSHFEAFTIATARLSGKLDMSTVDSRKAVKNALEAAKKSPLLAGLTVGGGKNFKPIYVSKIELVVKELKKIQ